MRAPVIKAWPLMLLKGTSLERKQHEFRFKQGINSEELADLANVVGFSRAARIMNNIPHVIQSDSFTRQEWAEMCKIANNLT